MKQKWALLLGAAAILLVAVCAFCYCHPTHYSYNDRFVIGSTKENIVDRYGAFYEEEMDQSGALYRAVYQIRDNTPELIMGYDDSLWYEVYFENEIAVRVELRRGYIGG